MKTFPDKDNFTTTLVIFKTISISCHGVANERSLLEIVVIYTFPLQGQSIYSSVTVPKCLVLGIFPSFKQHVLNLLVVIFPENFNCNNIAFHFQLNPAPISPGCDSQTRTHSMFLGKPTSSMRIHVISTYLRYPWPWTMAPMTSFSPQVTSVGKLYAYWTTHPDGLWDDNAYVSPNQMHLEARHSAVKSPVKTMRKVM